MLLRMQELWVQKQGNHPNEYEDAFHPDKLLRTENNCVALAIADGATEGAFSKQWANILCHCFVNNPDIPDEGEPVSWDAARSRYERFISMYKEKRAAKGPPLKWYEIPSLSQGSYAAFLGITVRENEQGGYVVHSIAYGDTCLFHTRNGEMLASFPVEHASDFGFRPWLVSSRERTDEQHSGIPSVRRREFYVQPGEEIYLATDAASQWFLSCYESDNDPTWHLAPFFAVKNRNTRFANWVNELRRQRTIRNDDTTFIKITFE